jgi:hypothetical protein
LTHVRMTAGYQSGDNYATAARASDGSSIIAYLPTQRQVTIRGSYIADTSMKAWWYNPATGAASLIGTYSTTGTRNFTPPSAGDWVLVIDAASLNFSAPGS